MDKIIETLANEINERHMSHSEISEFFMDNNVPFKNRGYIKNKALERSEQIWEEASL